MSAYQARVPALILGIDTTLRLDQDNEPQPDLLMAVPASAGGALRIAADGFLEGAPELIVEIAASSASYDLHQKLHAYRRNGVGEYLVVWRTEDAAIDWFVLEHGSYVPLQRTADGCLQSRRFPGLWLLPEAGLQADLAALQADIARGCATAEHRSFAARLTTSA